MTTPKRQEPGAGPLYRDIKRRITAGLESGEWRPGEPIPSEIDLAGRFGVSQGTVRKAVSELASENVLVRRQGRGTFVASHAHESAQLAFLRIAPDRGAMRSLTAELLECRRVKADVATAASLALEPGAPVIRIRRVLSLNGRPAIVEEARVPAAQFAGLRPDVIRQHGCMLYSMYESAFRLKIVEAEERLKAVAADADTAAMLDVPAGAPLLMMERVAYTYGHRPIEMRRGVCNTAEHHYANVIR